MTLEHNLQTYVLGNRLGQGTFGIVRAATNRISGQEVAIKLIPKGKMNLNMLKDEIENHAATHHKNVLRLFEVVETPTEYALVMEHASEGDLFDYIVKHTKVAETDSAMIFRQLIAAVAHCHEHLIVHRDIKPENILLNANMEVKLADFGLSAKFEKGVPLTEGVGSPNYAAPELLIRQCSYQGPEVDVWACGVVLYTLLCGCLPFDASTYAELFKHIKRGSYRQPGHISFEAKDLIKQMLTVDQVERISTPEIQKHSWLAPSKCDGGNDPTFRWASQQPVLVAQIPEVEAPQSSARPRAFTCMGPSMRGHQRFGHRYTTDGRSYTNCAVQHAKICPGSRGNCSRQARQFFGRRCAAS